MIDDASDESLERELFGVRARALPTMTLDIDDVLARAARMTPVRRERGMIAAWIAAAACILLAPSHPTGVLDDARAAYSDGLSCPASAMEPMASLSPGDGAMCAMEPSHLVCDRDVTISLATP